MREIDRSVGEFTTGGRKKLCLNDLLTYVKLNEGIADAKRAAIIDS